MIWRACVPWTVRCGKQWPQEQPQRLQVVKISQKNVRWTCQTPLSTQAVEFARKMAKETIWLCLNEFDISIFIQNSFQMRLWLISQSLLGSALAFPLTPCPYLEVHPKNLFRWDCGSSLCWALPRATPLPSQRPPPTPCPTRWPPPTQWRGECTKYKYVWILDLCKNPDFEFLKMIST